MLNREVVAKYIEHPEFRKALPELKSFYDRYETRKNSCSGCSRNALKMDYKSIALKICTDGDMITRYNEFIEQHGSPSEKATPIVDRKKINYQKLKIDIDGFTKLLPMSEIREMLFMHFPELVEETYRLVSNHGYGSRPTYEIVSKLYDAVYGSEVPFEEFYKYVARNKIHMDLYQKKIKLFKIHKLRGENFIKLENLINEFLVNRELISMSMDPKLPIATVVYR